jgi:hypothetical protein
MINKTRFLILILLPLFSCNGNMTLDDLPGNDRLQELVRDMEKEILVLEEEIIELKDFYQAILKNKDSLLLNADKSKYKINGSFSDNMPLENSDLSKVILSTKSPNKGKSLEEVYFTNSLDSAFKTVYKKHNIIAQLYSNSAMQVSRVYPPYDAENLVDPNIDIPTFNFYYEADEEHNPSKGPVWIPEVYVDPAGKGWILSLIHPVYEGDNLFAVLGIDITVDEILHRFLEIENGDLFIVNGKGDIVSGKSSAIEALSLPPLKNHIYRETIQSDNFRISDFNLFNSKSEQVRKMAQAFLLQEEEKFLFENEHDLTSAIATSFDFTDWYLIEINPSQNGN